MAPSGSSHDDDDDPLWLAIKPPPDETPEQAALRRKREVEAKLISDQIDEQIEQEIALLRKKKVIRLLLLGQSGSGKSTMLKQFQLRHSRNAFQNERLSWRLVIQLDLVKSIRRILEAALNAQSAPNSPMTESPVVPSADRFDTSASDIDYPPMSVDYFQSTLTDSTRDTTDFTALKMRLMPLRWAEEILATKLKTGVVNDVGDADIDKVANLIFQARDDMLILWISPTARDLLERKKINVPESSCRFLDDMYRVTQRDYVPTDDDILNARLTTVGIFEHSFQINLNGDKLLDWRICDVGGSRSQRATWAPFFDNVQAIIFLAPVSAFDQVLAEDPRVNRLEDSLLLWKELCKNTILSKVPLILVLSKCDILKRKLLSGVQLSKYMISYGDRSNDYDSALTYIRSKFLAISKQCSKYPEREVSLFETSINNPYQVDYIITAVRTIILRGHLRTSKLLKAETEGRGDTLSGREHR